MTTNIYLDDIAGYHEEKEEAKKLITILKNFKIYAEKGIYVPKGLILSGAPGVGKTMLAKAIATEAGVQLFEYESSEGIDEEENVESLKRIFKKARENSPAIIFIDELDELVSTDEFSSDFSRKTYKTLLTEIDGVKSSEGVLVIATTNHRESLSCALTRSGRMDKHITVGIPGLEDRKEICELYLKKHPCLIGIDPVALARKTPGLTGADIKTLVNETLIDCDSRGVETPTIRDFEKNARPIMFKEIKKRKVKIDDSVIYHEIGHFVVGYAIKGTIGSISVERYGNIEGHVIVQDDKQKITRNSIISELAVILGGMAGEETFTHDISYGVFDDVTKAKRMTAYAMNCGLFGFSNIRNAVRRGMDEGPQNSPKRLERAEYLESEILEEAYAMAKKALSTHESLAKYLYKVVADRKTLSDDEMAEEVENFKKSTNTRIKEEHI